ncbi:MAG: helix-turn-helix transcriptional regulator [Chloroflexales bacterium]|nr:helix-turn-helix transcriptional regulator [Chloroflexales bacterium]
MSHRSLGDWMRCQRSLRDRTQEALAEEVGCSVQTIRAFESGRRRPSRPMAQRLASVLAIPPDDREAFLSAARAPIARAAPAAAPDDPAAYLAHLADQAQGELFGPGQQRWLAQLDTELDKIRAALGWALDDDAPDLAARAALALLAASAIERFWHGRGHQAEGQRWLERGLAMIDQEGLEVDPAVLVSALRSIGWLAKLRGERAQALTALHRCVALCRAIGDKQGMSDALDTLGDQAVVDGDAIAATWFYEESLALRRGLGRPELVALSLNGLGHAAVVRGYYEQAAERFLESLAALSDRDDRRSTAMALHGLGLARLRQGSLDEAAPPLSQAMSLFHTLDNTLDVALCLELIGELLVLRVLTCGAEDAGALGEAARLWGAAEALLEPSGISLSPPDLARRDALVSATRLRVGPEPFLARWAEGRALTQAQAVAAGLAAVRRSGPLG